MNNWISVKERLPDYTCQAMGEEFTFVIIAKGNLVTEACYKDGQFSLGSDIEIPGVTHWMPMPAPPIMSGDIIWNEDGTTTPVDCPS